MNINFVLVDKCSIVERIHVEISREDTMKKNIHLEEGK